MSMQRPIAWLAAAVLLTLAAGAPGRAWAVDETIYFSKPTGSGTVTVTISANGQQQQVTAQIKSTDSVDKKRTKVRRALEAKGYNTLEYFSATHGEAMTIFYLPKGATVKFDTGTTGEGKDAAASKNASAATVSFNGTFLATDFEDQPATFTAGVITPGGEAFVEYRAAGAAPGDLIDGAQVAAELYEALAGAAADLGAEVTLDGEALAVKFNDAGKGENGVYFGTSSLTEGVSSSLTLDAGDDTDATLP